MVKHCTEVDICNSNGHESEVDTGGDGGASSKDRTAKAAELGKSEKEKETQADGE